MQHEATVRQKEVFCYAIPRSIRRVRIASVSAFLVKLLLLSEATQKADAASSCSALFQSFRNAYKSRLAFQHAVVPLGKASGPRREDRYHRECYGYPWVVCRSEGAAARRRAAPWILNDSGRQEDVFGMRAIGEVGNVDSNSTHNRDEVDDHGDFGGVAVEGKAAAAEGLGVAEDTSSTSTQRESTGQFGTTRTNRQWKCNVNTSNFSATTAFCVDLRLFLCPYNSTYLSCEGVLLMNVSDNIPFRTSRLFSKVPGESVVRFTDILAVVVMGIRTRIASHAACLQVLSAYQVPGTYQVPNVSSRRGVKVRISIYYFVAVRNRLHQDSDTAVRHSSSRKAQPAIAACGHDIS